MGLLSLGDVLFDAFEVPGRIEFGGKQKLTVHKLIGGARVIDVLGRDDSVLKWRGVLSGGGASDRARRLDGLRVSGDVLKLTWDAFCYEVVISQLHLSFYNPWWIGYDIDCTVQQDLADAVTTYGSTLVDSLVADLSQFGALSGSVDTLNVASVSNLVLSGKTGQQQLLSSMVSLQTAVAQGIGVAESGLLSNDVGNLVSSAGSIAQLSCAQGFLDRSMANLAGSGV